MIFPEIRTEAAAAICPLDVAAVHVLNAACAPDGKRPATTGIVTLNQPALRWSLRVGVVVHVLQGTFRTQLGPAIREVSAGATVWLPPGTQVSHLGQSARAFFAAYPQHWREALAPYE
ncbi:hypothetical protein VK792_12455 [Mesobacterium sp. TK19101]|uniref:AraC family transcriptional regulator n=1 Tax=Mesobacterium hydrothermale TaxID=3111907 RepID=A0ABU6HI01_9RHOB|nr:hypothetical protein [Mesobacterium sp. TK19101]MEC3862097.1 hypothetical protein [Mesobacterium sp. TK19101]